MFDTLYAQIGGAVAVAVAVFAFLKGDEPERVGAGAYMISMLATWLIQDDTQLYGTQWGMLAIDAVMVAVYAALAWKSRRSWPVWAAALQSVVVMSHVLTLIDVRLPLAAFYAVMNLATYGILLALALSTWRSWRERRRTVWDGPRHFG